MKRIYFLILSILMGGTIAISYGQKPAHHPLAGNVNDTKTVH